MKQKILITDYVWPSIEPEKKILEDAGYEVVVPPDDSESTLIRYVGDVHGIIFCFGKVTSKVLENAKNCMVVSRYGIGVDNIDLVKATELGLVVTNVPDYCTDEVADHALGMLLSLNKNMITHTRQVVAGNWNKITLDFPGHRLSDSILGIVGYGRIGKALEKKAHDLGMKVLVNSRSLPENSQTKFGKSVSMDTLLSTSNFISLNLPLNKDTKNIIGKNEIQKMKKNSILINCSRGGLVDENAVAEALSTGHLFGAGFDVLENVSSTMNSFLFKQENVIITPHSAFYSEESTLDLEIKTANEVVRVLSGKMPKNLVNKDVIGKSRIGL
tara:strand:- start:224 stop:1210 length:987 start_codon:yes stop_codon:yes gene_type:complete